METPTSPMVADPSRRKRSFAAVVLTLVALAGVVGFWQSPAATGSFVAAASLAWAPAAPSAPHAPGGGEVVMQAVDVMSQRDLEMAKIAAEWDRLVQETKEHAMHHEYATTNHGSASTGTRDAAPRHHAAADGAARAAHNSAHKEASSSLFGKFIWKPIQKLFFGATPTARTAPEQRASSGSKASTAGLSSKDRLKAALPPAGRARAEATDLLKHMIAARVLSFDERKRLYRSWRNSLHPDRHIEDREVATEVFKFLGAAKEWFLPETLHQYSTA